MIANFLFDGFHSQNNEVKTRRNKFRRLYVLNATQHNTKYAMGIEINHQLNDAHSSNDDKQTKEEEETKRNQKKL